MKKLFAGVYENKTVLVTGHTGFKGSWLSYWLRQMGAQVVGYALDAPTNPNHIELLNLDIVSLRGDIRDLEKLHTVFEKYKPDIVFHLAAQPLVRYSYENPIETYETNVVGTLKVFEACKKTGVKAIINITSDKCYENKEWVWGYRENDPLGGYDPYSSSKGCAELLTSSYRNSYFHSKDYGKTHTTLLASCRAGNVVGGGDWAKDRLLSDIMVATSKNEKVTIRNPKAVRPWQHVLEPLSGYLAVGQKLLEGKKEFATAWNFAPSQNGNITVEEVVLKCKKYWNDIKINKTCNNAESALHEAHYLKLDCTKAHTLLNWESVWESDTVFKKTVQWYKAYYESDKVLTSQDLVNYVNDARAKGLQWAN